MSTSAISAAATSALTGATGAKSGTSQLGQDEFLKLMLSQMKNQDPFKPQDPGAFIAQLAQFSTVSSTQAMQKDISTLSDSLRSSQVIDGTSLVGHNVMAATDSASLGATGSVDGAVSIPDGTTTAMLTVTDASGQLVRKMPLSTQTGLNTFTWDGTTDSGTRAAAGTYHIAAVANVGGANQQVETQMASVINSVTIDPTSHALTLNTDFGPIALSAVRRVM
jgi:flagellar basal-body rod modification protein FlgD